MQCGTCKKENDIDARYCEHCGRDLAVTPVDVPERKNRTALYVLIIVAAAVAAAVGYYKFFLPSGIAAVVNGEEILLAEVDARMQGLGQYSEIPADVLGRARYRVLNDLITERIAWQAAAQAGVRIPSADIDAAYEQLASASAADRAAFDAQIKARYGSTRAFRRSLERSLAIRKYVDEKIAAGIADPTLAGARVDQWLRDISGRATVRVALAEQLPGPGRGCGGSGGCGKGSAGCGSGSGCGTTPRTGSDASPQAKEARDAALAYWRDRYGDEPVEAKVLDFGCHIQVDVLKGKKIAKSLRYQNGAITEL
jgi:hypothetical protein